MADIKWLFFITAVFFLLLLFRHMQLKKQIRSLSRQMKELSNGNSEKMLDISLIDRDLEELVGIWNQYHAGQRQVAAGVLRHEVLLKESVANLSHDLRTPLTVILGHLQLLKNEALGPEQSQRVKIILNRAERMKELTESFYALLVLEEQQAAPQVENFNFSNLLMDLITEHAPVLEEKKIFPEIDLPDHSVYLHSDRTMVERILQNLLTNAIRYSAGTIKITLRESGSGLIFAIENPVKNYLKLDPARLFDRFYTGDPSRHDGSTGLGLAVVQTLVSALGGSVVAETEADRLVIVLRI